MQVPIAWDTPSCFNRWLLDRTGTLLTHWSDELSRQQRKTDEGRKDRVARPTCTVAGGCTRRWCRVESDIFGGLGVDPSQRLEVDFHA